MASLLAGGVCLSLEDSATIIGYLQNATPTTIGELDVTLQLGLLAAAARSGGGGGGAARPYTPSGASLTPLAPLQQSLDDSFGGGDYAEADDSVSGETPRGAEAPFSLNDSLNDPRKQLLALDDSGSTATPRESAASDATATSHTEQWCWASPAQDEAEMLARREAEEAAEHEQAELAATAAATAAGAAGQIKTERAAAKVANAPPPRRGGRERRPPPRESPVLGGKKQPRQGSRAKGLAVNRVKQIPIVDRSRVKQEKHDLPR